MRRPILRYHGGKFKMAATIIQHFPTHKIYVEPFGGAASILMNKPRCYAEIYNDLFPDVVNVMRVLRDSEQAAQLRNVCELTPFARDEFVADIDRTKPIEWARQVIFRSFAGFSSGGSSSGNSRTGFRSSSKRSGSTPAADWSNWPSQIDYFTNRLRGVTIENTTAMAAMSAHDSPKTLHYVDPPYLHETRIHKANHRIYEFEMANEQHVELLSFVNCLKGMVCLSGYRSELYDEMLKDWRRVDFDALADRASKRTECLWMNYKEPQTLFTK